jgi:bacillithiol system protein YtxJ
MHNGFVELRNIESLDQFLASANGDAIVILKHSDSCGISDRAYAELTKLARPIGVVTVQTARAVSNEIETRMGVAHETPQVLIIRDGKVVWSTSHGGVRAEAIETALEEVGRRQ